MGAANAEIRRMQWRCRRGMLELDLLFKGFVESYLQENNDIALTDEQVAALDTLLDMPDNDLWSLLVSHTVSGNLATQLLLSWLRAGNQTVTGTQAHAQGIATITDSNDLLTRYFQGLRS